MKKALIVTRVSGFVPQFELDHVKILQNLGYEVHYAANMNVVVYGKDNSRLEGTGLICHHIDFCRSPFSTRVVESYRALKELLCREEFDLIHCHMPMSGVVARFAAQAVYRKNKKRVLVLYTAHGFHFYKGAPFKNWIYYLPERFLSRYTDRLITMNEEDYVRAGRFPVRGKVEKISGVGISLQNMDSRDTQKTKEIRKEIRSRWHVGEDEFLLVSVGELTKNKNHLEILRVLAKYNVPKLKYMICGAGAMEEELKNYIREHQLADRVIMTGYCDEVENVLKSADCFVSPSQREGLSVAVMEAMRAGLPVIARKIRGNTDLIQEEKGGFLLEQPKEEEYDQVIRRLMASPELCDTMGKWNQKQVRKFSVEEVNAQMERIYKEVDEEFK